MADVQAKVLVDGAAAGPVVSLDEPVSFWGGFDAGTGRVIGRHPQRGVSLAGRVLVMPTGRGSTSASSVLAEAIHAGTGPAAIVLAETDPMIVLGALVAAELYDEGIPVLTVGPAGYALIAAAAEAAVSPGGTIRLG